MDIAYASVHSGDRPPDEIVAQHHSEVFAVNILCEHVRVIQRRHKLPSQTIYDWRHYLAVLQREPGALRNGAPFVELPTAFKQLQDQMLRRPGGDRQMVDILPLVLYHDEQAVLAAVETRNRSSQSRGLACFCAVPCLRRSPRRVARTISLRQGFWTPKVSWTFDTVAMRRRIVATDNCPAWPAM